MPRAVFISPHLDDAAFSAGGTIAGLAADGWQVSMVTVFTRSVPDPTGFALRCQTDKGLAPTADYMAVRRAEDAAAAAALGLDPDRDVHWLDLPEAPHRGYESPAELFAGVRAVDEPTADAVAERIAPHLAAGELVFAPLGIGGHVDHVHVVRAVAAVLARRPAGPLLRWHDAPYAFRAADRPRPDRVARIDDVLGRKLAACCAYGTQIGFQFGGPAALRDALAAEAADVAAMYAAEPDSAGTAVTAVTAVAEPFAADAARPAAGTHRLAAARGP